MERLNLSENLLTLYKNRLFIVPDMLISYILLKIK